MFEEQVKPKAEIGDKVKIISADEIRELGYDDHTKDSLIFLSEQNLIWEVTDIKYEGIDLYAYEVKYGVVSATLYDSDFDVLDIYKGKLYIDIPVYLCIDCQGGMCDRLCFGDKALIENANASLQSWSEPTIVLDGEEIEQITTVSQAIRTLSRDEFDVIKLEPNTVHVAENFIVNVGSKVTTYGKRDILIHNVEHIYDLIYRNVYNNPIIDLTVATDD